MTATKKEASDFPARFTAAALSPAVTALAAHQDVSFILRGTDWEYAYSNSAAREPQFTLTAANGIWEALTSATPPAGLHSIVYLVRTGAVELAGDQLSYERHVQVVRSLLDAARPSLQHTALGAPLTARGSYVRIETSLGLCDIYVERQGKGPQLLCFATAGSNTTQWHGIMTNSDITSRFEIITAEMPWHGRSTPSWGEPVGSYSLTPETYTEFIVAVADALELSNPVLVGVSMGGAAVVHAIATHPSRFAGAVSCQAGVSVTGRANPHLRGTVLNPTAFIPEWTYGLMNPASPEEFKQRVWWGYSSGGYGLYAADIDSYLAWDFAKVRDMLSSLSPHIAVLSGHYDTSVPTERSRELAELIPNWDPGHFLVVFSAYCRPCCPAFGNC